jgi:hypothetical protein
LKGDRAKIETKAPHALALRVEYVTRIADDRFHNPCGFGNVLQLASAHKKVSLRPFDIDQPVGAGRSKGQVVMASVSVLVVSASQVAAAAAVAAVIGECVSLNKGVGGDEEGGGAQLSADGGRSGRRVAANSTHAHATPWHSNPV